MSMTVLTVFQIVQLFIVYTFYTILLPGMVFGRSFKNKRATVRVVSYFCIGNYVAMMVVTFLSLMHICYTITIFIATIAVYVGAWSFVYKRSVKEIAINALTTLKYLLTGTMGRKNFLEKMKGTYMSALHPKLVAAVTLIREKKVDFFFIAALLVCMWIIYGREMMSQFGYAFSDQPVHNYWINNIGRQKMYVAGVYPMGYHGIIFFLYKMSGIDVYILLRIFGFWETFYIYLMIAVLLKVIGKRKYVGYMASIGVLLFGGYQYNAYFRYVQSLPQEYGQIFILPAVALIIVFIQEKYDEKKAYKKRKKITAKRKLAESKITGLILAIAVCDGFSGHFYDTMILAIFVVGIGLAYFVFVVRPSFFVSLLKYGLLGILLGILPMAVSLIMGNRLEGSINWGLSIVRGSEEEEEEEQVFYNEDGITSSEDGISVIVGDGFTIINDQAVYNQMMRELGKDPTESVVVNITEDEVEALDEEAALNGTLDSLGKKDQGSFTDRIKRLFPILAERMEYALFKGYCVGLKDIVLWMCGIATVLGIIFMIFKNPIYGGGVCMIGITLFLLLVLMAAETLKLPELMNVDRSRIYVAYCLPLLAGILLDSALYIVSLIVVYSKPAVWIEMIAGEMILVFMCAGNYLKIPQAAQQMQLSSSVICMTNVIRDEKDFEWTLVSASDERNMGFDHCYHYEMITFLRDMEGYDATQRVTIPTKHVYFFLEKYPVMIPPDAKENNNFEGFPITEEMALVDLRKKNGIQAYRNNDRWYTMARMKQWLDEFKVRYPREIEVYYETGDFICYRLTQNTYNLYNLAIDYYFNTLDYDNMGQVIVEYQSKKLAEMRLEQRS